MSILDKSKDKKDKALAKKKRNKIPQLTQYLHYVQTEPTEDYCKKEIARIENRLDKIKKQYQPPVNEYKFTKPQLSAMKKNYEKTWDVPKLKKQLQAMNYILDNN